LLAVIAERKELTSVPLNAAAFSGAFSSANSTNPHLTIIRHET
jgi:hypothetical protein